MLVDIAWLDRGQVASDVSSVLASVDGRGVEPVVVARGQVDHHVVKLVALGGHSVEQGLDLCVVLTVSNLLSSVRGVVLVTDVAEKELVQAVRSALDTVNSAVSSANFADREDSSVAGRADRGLVVFVADFTSSRLEGSGEEVGESCVLVEAVALSLFNLDAIDERETSEEGAANAARHVELADVASDSGLDAGHRDEVTDLLELLEQLVAEDDVEDAEDESEQGHAAIIEAGGQG